MLSNIPDALRRIGRRWKFQVQITRKVREDFAYDCAVDILAACGASRRTAIDPAGSVNPIGMRLTGIVRHHPGRGHA